MTALLARGPALLLTALTALPLAALAQATEAASATPEISAPAPIVRPAAAPALAAPATALAPPLWQGLTRSQKLVLMPLERDWDSLDAQGRSKWLEIAARFNSLPAEEQARLRERMGAWARSSPAERQQARIGFQAGQQMAADRRQAKWEAYQALPPEKRQELADKAAQKRTAKAQAPQVGTGSGPQAKSNLVPAAPKGLPLRPVATSVLQAKPGATTVLITQVKRLPAHQQAGQTKVFADPDLVDSKTLLPKQRIAAASR